MTWQSGSGGGIPGVTSDNQTPGGEVVAGALTAGDSAATSVPSYHSLYGNTGTYESPANQITSDDVSGVVQNAPLTRNSSVAAQTIDRSGALNGFDYLLPTQVVKDETAGTAPVARWEKQGTAQFQVDNDGVRIHSKLKTGASATHTLGAYSGKSVPIYDEAGTLLGYMPLYA